MPFRYDDLGRSPGSWASNLHSTVQFSSFPGAETEWKRESSAHIQWRDRAGFEPASLLCR